jgi:hypothetical protein
MKTATLEKALPNKWLQLALLVTVVLTLWAFLQEDSSEGEAIELADKRTTIFASNSNNQAKQSVVITEQQGVIAWDKLKRIALQGKVDNPFRVHSWLVVPSVKKLKPAPPPIPTAPPAPFTYMGKYEENSANSQIFLLANGKLYSAMQGKNIDEQWRLDGEDANSLRLTYLPLNLPQVLSKAAIPIAPEVIPAATPVAAEASL